MQALLYFSLYLHSSYYPPCFLPHSRSVPVAGLSSPLPRSIWHILPLLPSAASALVPPAKCPCRRLAKPASSLRLAYPLLPSAAPAPVPTRKAFLSRACQARSSSPSFQSRLRCSVCDVFSYLHDTANSTSIKIVHK